jgi:prepilin-type N-terminal cleavage/methylation domain-containing protein/prepilin-type processing-associated H-X9-DG protein
MAQLVRRGELGFESAQSLLQQRETPTAIVAVGRIRCRRIGDFQESFLLLASSSLIDRINNPLTNPPKLLYSLPAVSHYRTMTCREIRSLLRRGSATDPGFTLIELLVVIAIVGVLAGLLLPALARARVKATGIACMNHHRQLALACQLYVDDFGDALPYNFGEPDTRRTVAEGRYLNWANNVMNWELDAMNTNLALIGAGGLGPYCAGSPELFRCPSDRVLSDLQRDAGWRGRTRSISMNAMVGNAGSFMTEDYNVNNPAYRQFTRLTQIPEPSLLFVFIEEHPDSINDGYFLNRLAIREWTDLPASYHDGGANLTFADGHVQFRRWLDASTRPPARPDGARLPFAVAGDQSSDFEWLMERTTLRRSGYYRNAYGPED